MTERFSAGQLAHFAATYQADGVVHLPGLLDADWIERLTAAVTAARAVLTSARPARNPVADPQATEGSKGEVPDAADAGYASADHSVAAGRCTIRWLWRDRIEVRRFFTESGVAPVVAAVIGARHLQYWFDLTFIHDSGAAGAGTPWHHDIAAFPCKGQQIPSLWIAMSDVSRDMSPLSCIRGSHRNPAMFRPPVYVQQGSPLPDGYAELPDVEAQLKRGDCEAISWNIRAGDALVIHPYTLHGAPANRSDRQRIAFTTRWAGDDVVWRPDELSMKIPGIDLSQVPRGQRPTGEFFPYAYHAEEASSP